MLRSRSHTSSFLAVTVAFLVTSISCISRPDSSYPVEEVHPGDEDEPPADEEDTPFCRAMRPVTAELRMSIGDDIKCILMDYNETGYFGHSGNEMESSFRNACFHGLSRYESQVETIEKPLGSIKSSVNTEIEIDPSGGIDLSEYGIVPALYQFHGVQGPLVATVTIGFREPAVRSVRDLGYTLAQLAGNQGTSTEVRESIRSCTTQLCSQETVYTSNIVSARPEVTIRLKRGTAQRLRPTSSKEALKIARQGERSFIIRPSKRLNFAAQVSSSRNLMVGHNACGPSGGRGRRTTEISPSCTTSSHRTIKATYRGCGRSGDRRSRSVRCEFLLTSADYDKDVEVYVRDRNRSARFVDDQGAPHTASWGQLANIETESFARTTLVADIPTKLTLQYDDVPKGVERISKLSFYIRAQGYSEVTFRELQVLDGSEFPSCFSRG